MKTTKVLILSALAMAVVCNGFAQGAIDVGNNFGAGVFRAPIYGFEPGTFVRIVGQPGPPAFPTGTTVYTGPRLSGTGFAFGFYASTTGITTDASALSLIGTLGFGTAGTAGFVTTTTMNVPGVAAGNPTTWQIRVWDLNSGATWSTAVGRGASPLVNSGPLGGITASGPVLNPLTVGWTSFNFWFYEVPEPNTFMLAGLGAVLMFFIRRRKICISNP